MNQAIIQASMQASTHSLTTPNTSVATIFNDFIASVGPSIIQITDIDTLISKFKHYNQELNIDDTTRSAIECILEHKCIPIYIEKGSYIAKKDISIYVAKYDDIPRARDYYCVLMPEHKYTTFEADTTNDNFIAYFIDAGKEAEFIAHEKNLAQQAQKETGMYLAQYDTEKRKPVLVACNPETEYINYMMLRYPCEGLFRLSKTLRDGILSEYICMHLCDINYGDNKVVPMFICDVLELCK